MKKMLQRASIASGIAVTAPMLALAKDPTTPTGISPVGSTLGNITVASLLVKVIGWVLAFSAAVAVLFLILGGLQYVTSGGNDQRITKAKQTILYAVIGLIVIALSYAIVTFIAKNIADVVN